MKKNYGVFIRGCSKRVFKKHYGGRVNVDGYDYSFNDYSKLIKEFKSINVGDLIYNPYRNIFEPVKEVKFSWLKMKTRYGKMPKRFPNIRFLDVVIITETDYVIYDFDYRLIVDTDDFKKAPIPNTTLKVWY
jgi:hypothetical protein